MHLKFGVHMLDAINLLVPNFHISIIVVNEIWCLKIKKTTDWYQSLEIQ